MSPSQRRDLPRRPASGKGRAAHGVPPCPLASCTSAPPRAAASPAERSRVVELAVMLSAAKLLAVLVFALWSAVLAWTFVLGCTVFHSESED